MHTTGYSTLQSVTPKTQTIGQLHWWKIISWSHTIRCSLDIWCKSQIGYWKYHSFKWKETQKKTEHEKQYCRGLSNEILCNFLTQGDAKLTEVKVWGPKKSLARVLPAARKLKCELKPVLQPLEPQGRTVSYLKSS